MKKVRRWISKPFGWVGIIFGGIGIFFLILQGVITHGLDVESKRMKALKGYVDELNLQLKKGKE